MRRNAMRLVCWAAVALMFAASPWRATAQSPTDKFRIVSQNWHRYSGLAVADITFENANDDRVNEPVIACDFLKPTGELIGTRGTTIHRAFRPGRTKVEGIHFSLREKDAVPGPCRVLSVATSPAPQ